MLGSIAQPENKHTTTHTLTNTERHKILRGSAIAYVHGRDNDHYNCNGITMKEEEEIHTYSTLTHTHTEALCLSLTYHSTHSSPEEDFSASTRLTGVRRNTLSLSVSTPLKHGLREDPSAGLGLGSGDEDWPCQSLFIYRQVKRE